MRIKLDNRIRTLIENGIIMRHRSMFVIIGEKARDQVATLYQIMVKASTAQRPTVCRIFLDFFIKFLIFWCSGIIYFFGSIRVAGSNPFGYFFLKLIRKNILEPF